MMGLGNNNKKERRKRKEERNLVEEQVIHSPRFFDLTTKITSKTVVYPGDPSFSYESISSIKNGESFELCLMSLGNHTGTHIDFPSHVQENGKTSSDYPIDQLIGAGLIIEVPENHEVITKQFIQDQTDIKNNDFVFFKTKNSEISKQKPFVDNYVYIEPNASEELIRKGVKIVGIDYISVDSPHADDLPVHHSLLSNDILIVESLELNGAPIGRCKIFIITNNIPDMDGLPARVFAQV